MYRHNAWLVVTTAAATLALDGTAALRSFLVRIPALNVRRARIAHLPSGIRISAFLVLDSRRGVATLALPHAALVLRHRHALRFT